MAPMGYFYSMKNLYLICLCLISINVIGQNLSKHANQKRGVIIDGYDLVSYFDGNPQKGSDSWQFQYMGLTYRFKSEENKNTFKANPEKYIPQYGGWCAYAMGESGDKVKVDPKTYKIVDGKLYLFYNFGKNNTLIYWNENEQSLKSMADKYWSETLN